MGKILSIAWGLVTAWTFICAFTDNSILGICRIFAIGVVIGLCIYRNKIPDVKEWTTLILALLVIFLAWNVPWISIEVFLKNAEIREFTLYGSVILSLIMSDGE